MKKPIKSAKGVANATTGVITKTAGFVASTILGIGKGVFHPIASTRPRVPEAAPGAAPGLEHYLKHAEEDVPVRITIVDYGKDFHDVTCCVEVEEALRLPRKENQLVRWINVDGLNPQVIDKLTRHFGVHALSAEDVLNTYQRPKIEFFENHVQLVLRQIQVDENKLKNEQISFFLFKDTLISFQEEPGDVFDPVRKRIENVNSRFRNNRADYLFYALIDSIVDHLFPVLEGYGAVIEELEDAILENPTPQCQQRLFAIKRDLSLQRRILWPMREIIDAIYRDESGLIKEELRTFFKDVHDHTMQVIDLLETYRDTASGLNDLYQSSVGNKMNEIMKVLTIMASFFIPITFFAGVYGMNFEYIPELGWHYSYFVFWGICLSITAGLAIFFWRKGWIGS